MRIVRPMRAMASFRHVQPARCVGGRCSVNMYAPVPYCTVTFTPAQSANACHAYVAEDAEGAEPVKSMQSYRAVESTYSGREARKGLQRIAFCRQPSPSFRCTRIVKCAVRYLYMISYVVCRTAEVGQLSGPKGWIAERSAIQSPWPRIMM
ncbi:hypothetical protein BCV70DRAFT_63182 [Testicularia cyperi]|uniref:Uncharacterized protein n=1 Tax=Testicularia cyperi TaxID=1882483 RepID=A0A317XYD3_9BASI|nr:hypothetical protein BCV70DRAFT_63182 [Testicularia cyperi]